MLKERIIELILRDLFGDDQSYRDTVNDCADSIMNCREMNDIRSALDSTMDVIADTHGYNDDGEIDDDLEPESSAADIVQDLCGIELSVAEALEHVGSPLSISFTVEVAGVTIGTYATRAAADDAAKDRGVAVITAFAEDDEQETMVCALCSKVEYEQDAISRGWIPDYLDDDEHKMDPVCVECCAARITTNEDGDSILIKTAH